MADFINTVDVVGDDALIDSIITRTITEFADDQIEVIGHYAFAKCGSLTDVNVPNVKEMKIGAFSEANKLTNVQCPAVEKLGDQVFYGSHKIAKLDFTVLTEIGALVFGNGPLTALILRSSTMCTLKAKNAIGYSGTYIYVPAALVDTYKADSVWSNFAARIRAIEDYPEITG